MTRLFRPGQKQKTFEFECECCGQLHTGSPSFAYQRPIYWFHVPEGERQTRINIDDDTCAIDDEYFFIRAVLEIPIHDVDEPFTWGLWVSQSKKNFERYIETFNQDPGGYTSTGWLPVTMPGYNRRDPEDELENLACDVEWQSSGARPLIHPEECDHPLYHDYKNGISWERAAELARKFMHPDG